MSKTVVVAILDGCGTWPLILKEEQRLWVFQNKVLKKIFAAGGYEVPQHGNRMRNWGPHSLNFSRNWEPHSLNFSPTIIRVIESRKVRWAGHVTRMGQRRGACRIFVVKSEGKGPLGMSERRWEDNTNMQRKGIKLEGSLYWIELA